MMSVDGSRELIQGKNLKGIGCNSCKYFYISWNKKYPYGCRAMGFMSSNLPSVAVLEIEGRDCLSFVEKDTKLRDCKRLQNDLMKGKSGNKRVNVVI